MLAKHLHLVSLASKNQDMSDGVWSSSVVSRDESRYVASMNEFEGHNMEDKQPRHYTQEATTVINKPRNLETKLKMLRFSIATLIVITSALTIHLCRADSEGAGLAPKENSSMSAQPKRELGLTSNQIASSQSISNPILGSEEEEEEEEQQVAGDLNFGLMNAQQDKLQTMRKLFNQNQQQQAEPSEQEGGSVAEVAAPNAHHLNHSQCMHKGRVYHEGEQVPIEEQPCLSCTCKLAILQCYLRVCPPIVSLEAHKRKLLELQSHNGSASEEHCQMVREASQCCPVLRCSQGVAPKGEQQVLAAGSNGTSLAANSQLASGANDIVEAQQSVRVEQTVSMQQQQPAQLINRSSDADSNSSESQLPKLTVINGPVGQPDSILLITSNPQSILQPQHRQLASANVSALSVAASSNNARNNPAVQSAALLEALLETIYSSAAAQQLNGLNLQGACMLNGSLYFEGSAVLAPQQGQESAPHQLGSSAGQRQACQYCYCIRQKIMCVRPRCHLMISGCTPKYSNEFACCPTSYSCSTTPPNSLLAPSSSLLMSANGALTRSGSSLPARLSAVVEQALARLTRIEDARQAAPAQPADVSLELTPRQADGGDSGSTGGATKETRPGGSLVSMLSSILLGTPEGNNETAIIGATIPSEREDETSRETSTAPTATITSTTTTTTTTTTSTTTTSTTSTTPAPTTSGSDGRDSGSTTTSTTTTELPASDDEPNEGSDNDEEEEKGTGNDEPAADLQRTKATTTAPPKEASAGTPKSSTGRPKKQWSRDKSGSSRKGASASRRKVATTEGPSSSVADFLEPMNKLGPHIAGASSPIGCLENGRAYAIGEQIPTLESCKHCYCGPEGTKECRMVECSLKVAHNCRPITPEGHCCPIRYECPTSEGGAAHGKTNQRPSFGGHSLSSAPLSRDTDQCSGLGADCTISSIASQFGDEQTPLLKSTRFLDEPPNNNHSHPLASPAPGPGRQTAIGDDQAAPSSALSLTEELNKFIMQINGSATGTTQAQRSAGDDATTDSTPPTTGLPSLDKRDYHSVQPASEMAQPPVIPHGMMGIPSIEPEPLSESLLNSGGLTTSINDNITNSPPTMSSVEYAISNQQLGDTANQEEGAGGSQVSPASGRDLRSTTNAHMLANDLPDGSGGLASPHLGHISPVPLLADLNYVLPTAGARNQSELQPSALHDYANDSFGAANGDVQALNIRSLHSTSDQQRSNLLLAGHVYGQPPAANNHSSTVVFDDELGGGAVNHQRQPTSRQQQFHGDALTVPPANNGTNATVAGGGAEWQTTPSPPQPTTGTPIGLDAERSLSPETSGWLRPLPNWIRSFGQRLSGNHNELRGAATSEHFLQPSEQSRLVASARTINGQQASSSPFMSILRSLIATPQYNEAQEKDDGRLGKLVMRPLAATTNDGSDEPVNRLKTHSLFQSPTVMANNHRARSVGDSPSLGRHSGQSEAFSSASPRPYGSHTDTVEIVTAPMPHDPEVFGQAPRASQRVEGSGDTKEMVVMASSTFARRSGMVHDDSLASEEEQGGSGGREQSVRYFSSVSSASTNPHGAPLAPITLRSFSSKALDGPKRESGLVSPPKQPLTCLDEQTNKTYQANEIIPKDDDPCKTCTCVLGKQLCSQLICPQKPATDCKEERRPGQCCPSYLCSNQVTHLSSDSAASATDEAASSAQESAGTRSYHQQPMLQAPQQQAAPRRHQGQPTQRAMAHINDQPMDLQRTHSKQKTLNGLYAGGSGGFASPLVHSKFDTGQAGMVEVASSRPSGQQQNTSAGQNMTPLARNGAPLVQVPLASRLPPVPIRLSDLASILPPHLRFRPQEKLGPNATNFSGQNVNQFQNNQEQQRFIFPGQLQQIASSVANRANLPNQHSPRPQEMQQQQQQPMSQRIDQLAKPNQLKYQLLGSPFLRPPLLPDQHQLQQQQRQPFGSFNAQQPTRRQDDTQTNQISFSLPSTSFGGNNQMQITNHWPASLKPPVVVSSASSPSTGNPQINHQQEQTESVSSNNNSFGWKLPQAIDRHQVPQQPSQTISTQLVPGQQLSAIDNNPMVSNSRPLMMPQDKISFRQQQPLVSPPVMSVLDTNRNISNLTSDHANSATSSLMGQTTETSGFKPIAPPSLLLASRPHPKEESTLLRMQPLDFAQKIPPTTTTTAASTISSEEKSLLAEVAISRLNATTEQPEQSTLINTMNSLLISNIGNQVPGLSETQAPVTATTTTSVLTSTKDLQAQGLISQSSGDSTDETTSTATTTTTTTVRPTSNDESSVHLEDKSNWQAGISSATPEQISSTTAASKQAGDSDTSDDPFNLFKVSECNIYGQVYKVGQFIERLSDRCKQCHCTSNGVDCMQIKC